MSAGRRRGDHARWIVLPVRGIAQGKSRLADTLDAVERARLNRWLLRHTLRVYARWHGSLDRCIVVSACARTLAITAAAGAVALMEPRPARGLNRAIAAGTAYARQRGGRIVLVAACDLPELSAQALDALAGRPWQRARIALATDEEGTGTNALEIASRAHFDYAFGADSRMRHVASASARGWGHAVCVHPGLTLDIDRPEDLRAWRSLAAVGAGVTRVL